MLLARIVLQIVQLQPLILEELDQFPVANANSTPRTAALVAVVWVVPIDRPGRQERKVRGPSTPISVGRDYFFSCILNVATVPRALVLVWNESARVLDPQGVTRTAVTL